MPGATRTERSRGASDRPKRARALAVDPDVVARRLARLARVARARAAYTRRAAARGRCAARNEEGP